MATYIALMNFTDQGIRSVKDTTKRAEAVMEAARKFGASMPQIYWTLGQYDLVAVIEAQDRLISEPSGRSAGIKVADVAELVNKLRNEAKVI